ncbi:fungal-specific transcription factor domain-containing protein, partial [Mycena epipterygia]
MELYPTTGVLYFPITDGDDPAPGSKRRRLRGACDTCRRKKIRCDSATMPDNVCSNCIAFNSQCTHESYTKVVQIENGPSPPPSTPSASKSARPDSDDYNGKTAQEHVDTILIQSTVYIATPDLRNILLDVARYSRSLEHEVEKYKAQAQLSSSRSTSLEFKSTPLPSGTSSSSYDDNPVDSGPEGILCDDFKSLTLVAGARNRYFGRSSGPYLIQTARAMKEDHDGPDVRQPNPTQRQEFWTSPWEKRPAIPVPVFQFPPRDLLDSLVSTFFGRINIVMCLLHRPTFERSIISGLHLVDYKFGAVVLGVCALASRYSDDPRVILEETNSRLSSGWEWFRQVRDLRADLHSAPTLHDVQLIFLSVVYLQGTCSPDACWVMTAIGVRHVQEIGVHMHKGTPSTIEEELFRRVFWMLVCSDALISSFLGRPRVMRDDDYDIDYPVACDDEYWENPDPHKRFQQPEGKPSVYAFIVVYLKLIEILGTVQKRIYSIKRSQRTSTWSQSVVAELDLKHRDAKILNQVRWDPNREDETFATQSACLYASYYHVQIQIHRSFIPSPGNNAPLSTAFPSLAICANSARSCSHVMEAQAKRGLVAHPHVVGAIMDSALVLLLNVWGARRTGHSANPRRAASDVQKCISVLKMYERRWQLAGRYCDLLFTIGNQLIDAPQVARTTLKRTRSKEAARPSTTPALQEPRTIAGSHRVSAAVEQQEQPHAIPDLSHLYALPISTEELGHLPVYESFDWGNPFGGHFPDADSGLALNFGAAQYRADLGFPST